MNPIVIGAVMALAMLAMLHRPIMEGTVTASTVSAGFVLAHLAFAIVLALAALLPPVRRQIVRHRPGIEHVMLAGAGVAVGAAHILIHTGWT